MTREEAIWEITRKLVEFYSPVRIYLFGSAARGDFNEYSDLDFLVVVPDDIADEALVDAIMVRLSPWSVFGNPIPDTAL